MTTMKELERRIQVIEERNKKVETDKSWETSFTRKIVIASLTYITIGIYMHFIGIQNSWLNAIIPTCGFVLSTLSLPLFKRIWNNLLYKRGE